MKLTQEENVQAKFAIDMAQIYYLVDGPLFPFPD